MTRRAKAPPRTCREWKVPDDEETGYCGNCIHCDGVDDEHDVCICDLDNPHKDWRYNDNEPCCDWEPDAWIRII